MDGKKWLQNTPSIYKACKALTVKGSTLWAPVSGYWGVTSWHQSFTLSNCSPTLCMIALSYVTSILMGEFNHVWPIRSYPGQQQLASPELINKKPSDRLYVYSVSRQMI